MTIKVLDAVKPPTPRVLTKSDLRSASVLVKCGQDYYLAYDHVEEGFCDVVSLGIYGRIFRQKIDQFVVVPKEESIDVRISNL